MMQKKGSKAEAGGYIKTDLHVTHCRLDSCNLKTAVIGYGL
jgi:hypothetical protein